NRSNWSTRTRTRTRGRSMSADRLGMLSKQRNLDLEELVPRIGFQDVDERLAGMVRRSEAGSGDHRLRLGPEIGDLQHRSRIGRGGEQADDPELAMQGAVRVVGLDPDIVEIDAAMDQRSGIRLGDDE